MMDKQTNKSIKHLNHSRTASKSLAFGGIIVLLIAVSPFLFYSYKSFPESQVWETSLFTLNTSFPDWYSFAWYFTGKAIPLYLLLLWFFTCRDWWHWIILVPIAMYSFQLWGVINESNNLDELLIGGIETQAVTEFYGEFGSGKTQICHTLCLTVQLPFDQGGLDGDVVYIDTENTFRPERLRDIAEIRGMDPDKALERIIVAKAYNSSHQELLVGELGNVLDTSNTRLVIVDSLMGHYRAEFLGRGTLATRQHRLNRFMHLLTRTAETRNVAIVITNQVMSAPDSFFGDPTRPVGGHVVAHTSTYRLYLRKSGKNRIAKMKDSPYHPEHEAVFTLNEKGIDDPTDAKKK